MRLQDGKGEAVLDFTEVENGIFEGLRQGEGVFILQNLAAARALTRSTDQMIGDWSVVRGGGRAICSITLTNNDAGNESFQLFVKPRCDPAFANFAPTIWRIERGELLLDLAPSARPGGSRPTTMRSGGACRIRPIRSCCRLG